MNAFQITGRMVTFSRITLETNDQDKILQQLTELAKSSPFAGIPVVIDSTVEQELIDLIQLFIRVDLQPIAVIDGILSEQARDIQFPIIPRDQSVTRLATTKGTTQTATTQHTSGQSKIQSMVVRSGQRVEENGDIVLYAGTNPTSEVVASGSIYSYGHSCGRLIAGWGGNQQAHIFCSPLVAEFVSIAGVYCTAENIPQQAKGKITHIYLNEQRRMIFEVL